MRSGNGRTGIEGWGGYTFVELLAAITLMGLLSAFAIARLTGSQARHRVDRAATVMAADLQYAQLLAVKQRRPIWVVASYPTPQYDMRDGVTQQIMFRRKLDSTSDYKLDELTAVNGVVVFFPNSVANITATFRLRAATYTRNIRISRAGQIRILKP